MIMMFVLFLLLVGYYSSGNPGKPEKIGMAWERILEKS